jgi:hypothetical protein
MSRSPCPYGGQPRRRRACGLNPDLRAHLDIARKANRRNYLLMQRHLVQARRQTWRDWVFLLMIAFCLFLIIATPIVLALWCIERLPRR